MSSQSVFVFMLNIKNEGLADVYTGSLYTPANVIYLSWTPADPRKPIYVENIVRA